MTGKDRISHEGVVQNIGIQTIEVVITSQSACSGCHAKGMCGMSEAKEKVVTAQRPDFDVKPGDKVLVVGTTGNALFSVVIVYVLPSVLILGSIFLLEKIENSELTAAIGSLLLLVLYFFILYLFRNRISKKIKFTVQRAEE